jgi:hypothetical protein
MLMISFSYLDTYRNIKHIFKFIYLTNLINITNNLKVITEYHLLISHH